MLAHRCAAPYIAARVRISSQRALLTGNLASRRQKNPSFVIQLKRTNSLFALTLKSSQLINALAALHFLSWTARDGEELVTADRASRI